MLTGVKNTGTLVHIVSALAVNNALPAGVLGITILPG